MKSSLQLDDEIRFCHHKKYCNCKDRKNITPGGPQIIITNPEPSPGAKEDRLFFLSYSIRNG
jgi:hypothetical protein